MLERAVLLRYLTIDMQMKNIWAVSFISWVLTLGVRASGGSMEVGHSVEVRHKFGSMIFRRNITLFWNKHLTGVVLLVHNQSSTSISDCIFLHRTIVEIKPKYVYQVLNAWPLNRCNNKQNSRWKVLKYRKVLEC